MRFVADENVPAASIRRLREGGFDVAAVAEEAPGAPDTEVLERAVAERRVLITFDRDFGELIFRHRLPSPPGVIYLRIIPETPDETAELLLRLVASSEVSFGGRFTVVTRTHARQRLLP